MAKGRGISTRRCGPSTLARSGSASGAPTRNSPAGRMRITGAAMSSLNAAPAGVAALTKAPSTIGSPEARRAITSRNRLTGAGAPGVAAPALAAVVRSAIQVSSLRH